MMMFMRINRTRGWRAMIAVAAVLAWVSGNTVAKEPSSALELARQLNQAFIEVADQVSPSVVVVQVAHKANFSEAEQDGDNPFWDLIPREFRRQFEQQHPPQPRERPRREN